MAQLETTLTLAHVGCHLDNHRGHYIVRDIIELAIGYGYLVSECERWMIDGYDDHNADEGYPNEYLIEMSDDARAWLNAGQDDRMNGQNFPPIIPDGYAWDYNDGDFGLYSTTGDETAAENGLERCPDCGDTGTVMTSEGYRHCVRFLSCWSDQR